MSQFTREILERWLTRDRDDIEYYKNNLVDMVNELYLLRTVQHPPKDPKPAFIEHSGCCGFKELDNLAGGKTPEETIRYLFPKAYNLSFGNRAVPKFVFFSQSYYRYITDNKDELHYFTHNAGYTLIPYGEEFVEYIKAKNLGEVIDLGTAVNFTARTVHAWIWKPDQAGLHALVTQLIGEENKLKEAWGAQIEAARRESLEPEPVVGGEQATEPSGEARSGTGGGMVETPNGDPTGSGRISVQQQVTRGASVRGASTRAVRTRTA